MEKVASAAADWFVRYLGSPLSNQEPDLATRDTRNASRRPFELTPCLTQRGARLISSASVFGGCSAAGVTPCVDPDPSERLAWIASLNPDTSDWIGL
jgi:hypothetical protein